MSDHDSVQSSWTKESYSRTLLYQCTSAETRWNKKKQSPVRRSSSPSSSSWLSSQSSSKTR